MQSIKNTRMKTKLLIFLIGSFLLYSSQVYSAKEKTDQKGELVKSSKIKIVGSPELENLLSAWISGYEKESAGQEIMVSYDGDNNADGNIYFFTSNNTIAGSESLAGKIVVGHEIIVPVMNAGNQVLTTLEREGITGTCFSKLLTGTANWGSIKESAGNVPLQVYVLDCGQLDAKLAEFCDIDESAISAEKVKSAEELLTMVRTDKDAIAFCRLSDAMNSSKTGFADGIKIVPIDKNQNGQIDHFEAIYSSPETITRGAWIGKYPRKLCSEIFAAPTSLPMDESSNEFLAWIIEEGQDTLPALGFSHLTTRERTAGMLALRPELPSDFTPSATGNPTIWITVIAALAFIFLVYVIIRGGIKRKSGVQSEDIAITSALNVNSINAPAGLFYDKTHTWAFMEQDGFVKVGINDFLPHVTGKLSQIKMKAPGEKIRKGEKILSIVREGKHLDIYSPVTGYIKSRNDILISSPAQLNTDPYLKGWVYQVEPTNWLREMKFMFMADKFKDWLDDEFVRLKDFLAASANSNAVVYNHVVLQDGGELKDDVLADLEPEVWEEFQTQFIDASK